MRACCPLLLGGVVALAIPAYAQEDGKLDVAVVKYAALKEVVTKNRGKVVVVDFWRLG